MNPTIRPFLELLGHQAAGGVTEVCVFQDGEVPTHVGYFDDLEAAAKAIAAHDGRGNIFVTLDPVKRDLLARYNNRLVEGSFKRKLKRTQNKEIVRKSWFLLDIDAERPSGISSTEAELQAAIELGRDVRDWLVLVGVPANTILTCKSGNGAYVLVRLPDYEISPDIPETTQAFTKYVAALFSTARVKIDCSVHNAARLICALGTMKMKGENIAERPHRRSAIGTVGGERFDPEQVQRCEPFDLFTLAARLLPKEEPKATKRVTAQRGGAFDIREHTINLCDAKETARGFTYYTCPGCGGFQKLFVNEATGAYGCFHIGAGTCSIEGIREGLGRPKAQAFTAQAKPSVNGHVRERESRRTPIMSATNNAQRASEGADTEPQECPYKANGVGLVWLKPLTNRNEGGETTIPVQLSNFTAEIASDVSRDDGTEQTRVFEVLARLAGEQHEHKGVVTAEDFDSLRWVGAILGAKAVVYPGKKEHTAVAIRLLSRNIRGRRVIAHTGWRNDGDGWHYYHTGGAINAEGLVDAEVELPAQLQPCQLPAPPTGSRLVEVVRAVAFDLPLVAPEKITLPLIGATFAAVITEPDFSLFLVGYTNSGKSELAALAQSFFGARFNAKSLPGNWSSSANSLEALAHTAKDCVLVIDDFCPLGSAQEQAKLHAAADRVHRAQGNHSGRLRCRTDGSVRPAKPPRGLAISTGEDLPRGESLRTRLAILPVEKDAVRWEQMTVCQRQAREGVYAEAHSAFLHWLATDDRLDKFIARATDEIGKLREKWLGSGASAYKRSATTLAYLQRSWNVWLEFARACGALDDDEVTGLREAVSAALEAIGRGQDSFQAGENPATRFIELLQAALSSGRAHLAGLNGGRPDIDYAQAFGWRDDEPQGDRIGWVESDDVYLQPDAAYKLVQAMAVNGEGLTITSRTLWKRLREAGLLASTENEERQTIKKLIGQTRPRVLHIRADRITCAH